jgi:hypothetical protein
MQPLAGRPYLNGIEYLTFPYEVTVPLMKDVQSQAPHASTTGSGVDNPDQQFVENFGRGSERNDTGYCNAELEKRFVAQSEIADRDKRRHLVWDIDKQLQ